MTAPAPDLLPGGRPRLDPDPYRGTVAGWLGSVAVLAVGLTFLFACTPPEDRTQTPAPGPTVTAPAEGDAGGASGGWTE